MNVLEIIPKEIWCTPAVYSVYHISKFEGRGGSIPLIFTVLLIGQ